MRDVYIAFQDGYWCAIEVGTDEILNKSWLYATCRAWCKRMGCFVVAVRQRG